MIGLAGVVVGALIAIFSVVVILDIGNWSAIRSAIPVGWRVSLGALWLLMGFGFMLIGIRHSIVRFVAIPGIVGSVIFIYFFKRVRQREE
jgi:hypothetical protein